MKKKIVGSMLLASVLGLGVIATSSFASGPLVVSPTVAPAVTTAPVVNAVPIKTKLIGTYKAVRAFWLSRALVR